MMHKSPHGDNVVPGIEAARTAGSGKTRDDAIVITGVADTFEGIATEYAILEERFGQRGIDWQILRQAYYPSEKRSYDVLTIEEANGNRHDIWFDITSFYGT